VHKLVECQFGIGDALRSDQPIYNEYGDLPRNNLAPNHGQQRGQAFLAHEFKSTDVTQLIRKLRFVEEGHSTYVLHHAGVILGQERDVDGTIALLDAMETKLICDRGLARAGCSLK
jgi:hypothetical protein